MALKGWVVHKVNRLFTRVDLPPRATPLGQAVMRRRGEKREPELRATAGHDSLPRPQHLGAYAPLVAAIREELEQFVASHVRMHLAIAERDRYLLTSIEVECIGGDETRELLQRFMREFKPRADQGVHREGGDRPAAERERDRPRALRRTQCGAGDGRRRARRSLRRVAGGASELRAAPGRAARTRSASRDAGRSSTSPAAGAKDKAGGIDAPRTPLAGRSLEVEIDDAHGSRHVTLTSVVPGRRYTVGNGEGSDIVVNGKYASRRHCEIWLDKGAWWVTDSGSTNGIRVESATSVLGRSGANAGKLGRADGDRSRARRAHRPVRRSRAASRRNIRGSCCARRAISARPPHRWRRGCRRPRRPRRRSSPRARARADLRSPCAWPRASARLRFPPSRCRFASAARAARRW